MPGVSKKINSSSTTTPTPTDRTCLSDALFVALHHLKLVEHTDTAAVKKHIQYRGDNVDATMLDVKNCGQQYGCDIQREIPPNGASLHGLESVLSRLDGIFLVMFEYKCEEGRTERHMATWLGPDQTLVDNKPLILVFNTDTEPDCLAKKKLKQARKKLFPTGSDVQVTQLYRCTKL